MPKILIVEDEDVIRLALRRLLERNDYQVDEADSVQKALSSYNVNDYDLIISDLRLPGAAGTDLINKSDAPVLIMTSYASLKSAVDSMKKGAIDYIAKPFDHDEMLETVERIIHSNTREQQANSTPEPSSNQRKQIADANGMIGSCKAMQQLYDHIRRAAPTDATILVHGETGTGKELVARAIHNQSTRSGKPIICVNCAAIPETLIESELFGYEKGAFTGANTNRTGLIEAADGGTLFLDEIGELPLEAQARLLRFIQEDEIRRIGSVESIKVNVRLICATHRDLKDMAHSGRFREDLYYRINVMKLELPPLRERGKDILELAETLLKNRCEKMKKPLMHFSPKAIQAITTYIWPGNIRELENAIERAVILCDRKEIDNELLDIDLELVDISQIRGRRNDPPPRQISSNSAPERRKPLHADPSEDLSLEDYFQRFVLEHQDSMSETELAQKLGVSRKCLWERRQRLGIPRKKVSSRSGS
ncbi:sigma-54-dependent transcriptional regulator [Zhongshania aquimaris]|uniref:Sigma-54 dependent transcriptional regulator n=1 Tax=Zhongshania aquimaris TaxID=2857107 RepID=A0ABS6VSW4_9GAMM|nr:sigma-54 dependent transcriptional regulator [Zhongshania aquimaris]MBW2941424.1 sigma-54 dependent transcriptional regulator [Zhongshania aquimaris]